MIIRPQPKQEKFLTTPADIAIYGGAAGGGKSFSLLLCPLYYINNPKFNAVFFRRSIVQLRNAGGLWSESRELYPLVNGTPREMYMDWKFPKGSIIKFAHIENDSTIYNWQGSQITLIGFDELTHFTEQQFFYLLSRNRSVCGVRPLVRATTNPERDSWVRKFISWWIDEHTGFPIPERSGKLRYFVRYNDKLIWDNDPQKLLVYGEAKSVTFIPASLNDNQVLMQNDPGYLANLQSQNKVERAKLLDGNWNASYDNYGSVINRDDFKKYNLIEKLNIPGSYFSESYFVLDGASRTSEANDYSVLGLWAKSKFNKEFYIIDWWRVKLQEPDLEQMIIKVWNQWKSLLSPKGINIERGSCGIGMMQRLPRQGIPCYELKPQKDKFLRLNDGLGIIKSKWVNLPEEASWVNTFLEECECFRADMKHMIMDGELKPHDDQVDNLAYAISTQINKNITVDIYRPSPHYAQRRSILFDK